MIVDLALRTLQQCATQWQPGDKVDCRRVSVTQLSKWSYTQIAVVLCSLQCLQCLQETEQCPIPGVQRLCILSAARQWRAVTLLLYLYVSRQCGLIALMCCTNATPKLQYIHQTDSNNKHTSTINTNASVVSIGTCTCGNVGQQSICVLVLLV